MKTKLILVGFVVLLAAAMLATRTAGNGVPAFFLSLDAGFDAWDVYHRHIDAAEDGEADSIYVIAEVLAHCRAAPKNRDDLRNIQRQRIPGTFKEYAKRAYRRCARLSQNGLIASADEQRGWQDATLESGHPLSRLKYYDLPEKQHREYVGQVLKTSWPEPFMTGDALFHTLAIWQDDAIRAGALELLVCSYHFRCEAHDIWTRITAEFDPQQIDEIVLVAREIDRAIRAGNLEVSAQ